MILRQSSSGSCDFPITRRNNPLPLHVISLILYPAIFFWLYSLRGLQERHTVYKCSRKAPRTYILQLMSLNCGQWSAWCNAMESKVIKATRPNTQNGGALSLSLRNVVCKGLRTSEAVCDARKQPKMQMYNWDARSDNKWVKTGSTNFKSYLFNLRISGWTGVGDMFILYPLYFFLIPLCWYECQVVSDPKVRWTLSFGAEMLMHSSLARILSRKLAKITWVFSQFQRQKVLLSFISPGQFACTRLLSIVWEWPDLY